MMQPFLRRILCADDDASTVEFLELWLAQQGYEVQTARTKAELLALAQQELFDLYLLDDWLDGYEGDLLQPLRELDSTTPIVIISGDLRATNEAKALRFGAQSFLPKPLDLDLTAATIQRLICGPEQDLLTPDAGSKPRLDQWLSPNQAMPNDAA